MRWRNSYRITLCRQLVRPATGPGTPCQSHERQPVEHSPPLGPDALDRLLQFCERETQVPVEVDWQRIATRGAQEVLKRADRDGHARIVRS